MKTSISIILALCMCLSVFALTACGKNNEPVPPSGEVVGGWTVNTEFVEADIPEEAKAAFDKAIEGYTGVGLVPVAYLGSQVVAGVNYSFLCTSTAILAKPVVSLSVVTVFSALDGSAKITDVVKLDISKFNTDAEDAQFDPSGILGGRYVAEASGTALPENAQTAFDKAAAGLMGVNYTPLALMGTQVVAGTNYAILCRASTVTAEPAYALAVMIVYADLQGNAEAIHINAFNY